MGCEFFPFADVFGDFAQIVFFAVGGDLYIAFFAVAVAEISVNAFDFVVEYYQSVIFANQTVFSDYQIVVVHLRTVFEIVYYTFVHIIFLEVFHSFIKVFSGFDYIAVINQKQE